MGLISKIFGFDNPEEEIEVKESAEKHLRKLSKEYRKKSDLDIARRRAERLVRQANEKANNTRRKPRC